MVLIFYSIPILTFLFGYYLNNFSDDYVKSEIEYVDKFGNLPDIGFDQKSSCGEVIFMGFSNVYTDCKSLGCDADVYEYKFIEKGQHIIVNGKRLQGAYCIPKGINKCNLNVSSAVIGPDGYQCVSRFPSILGGNTGNDIIACDGIIDDHLLGKQYVNYVPTNLQLTSFDDRLDDNSFRFTCGGKNIIPYPPTLGSRLEADKDLCSILDPVNGKFNDKEFKCDCIRYLNDDKESICSGCVEGYRADTNIHGTAFTYTIGRDCVDPFENNPLASRVKMACGPNTLSNNKRCEQAIVLATNTYSPQANAYISG